NDVEAIISKTCGCTVTDLFLRKTDISDDIVQVLASCKPNYIRLNGEDHGFFFGRGILWLDLSYSNVTAKGVNRILKDHRELLRLDLSGLRITAAVFDGVESLKLRILSMQRIPPDLEVAGKLTAYSIKELFLNESTINDDFVAQLALEGRNRRNELV